MQRRTQDSRAARVCGAQRDNILYAPITDTTPAAEAVLVRIQRAVTGEQRALLALEMSLFARELSKAGHSARSSRLDGCAGGARSLEDRILAAALAAQTAMNIEVVFRKITAALNQATPAQLRAFAQSLPSEEYYVDLDAAVEAHSGALCST
jgi:hypothetical protein